MYICIYVYVYICMIICIHIHAHIFTGFSIPSCCFFALLVDIFETEDDATLPWALVAFHIFHQLLAFLDLSTLL